MKFGKVDHPEDIDFALPDDHSGTSNVLSDNSSDSLSVYVGCAKWNRKDLNNFYPSGTSDELKYYSSQFNAVELNATFYNIFDPKQIEAWNQKVPGGFKFFPKVNRYISHLKWLNNMEERTDDFIDSIVHFKEHLGTVFLQLRGKFKPKFFDRVQHFIEYWPEGIPLAVELRHKDWFQNEGVAQDLYQLFEEHNITNVITDTAGRRDLLHMRLTNNDTFIRYVGANHPTDFDRLDEWVERLASWHEQGLQNIAFFVHQNKEKKSPELAAHLLEHLNHALPINLYVPNIDATKQTELL